MRLHLSLALAASLSMPGLAGADNGFFAGIGIGGTQTDTTLKSLDILPPAGESLQGGADPGFKETGFAWKVFGGYRFLDFLGVEVGYINLGEPDNSYCVTDNPPPGVACESREWSVESEVDGFTVNAMAFLPLGERWDVFAKLGVFAWDAEVSGIMKADGVTQPPGNNPPTGCPPYRPGNPSCEKNVKDDGSDLTAGFGGGVKLSDHVRLQGEFEWYDVSVMDSLWTINFSAVYQF